MIPKIIHYCWFGGNEKSEFILHCMASWEIYLPDYEIVEWNETNFNINANVFTKEAYSKKKWAFVSDYVRAYALYNFGGIYLDTDVEIRRNLDVFLSHGAFSGFEEPKLAFTALWGAEKGHNWPKKIIDYYDKLQTFEERTNTQIISDFLVEYYKVDSLNDKFQKLEGEIYIYPSVFFCLDIESSYAVHHFEGSWLENENINYKEYLLKRYFKSKFLKYLDSDNVVENLYDENFFTTKDLLKFIFKRLKKRYLS